MLIVLNLDSYYLIRFFRFQVLEKDRTFTLKKNIGNTKMLKRFFLNLII